ncbi:5-(carboxyamino)imidazole ribonucleotide synthase [Rossellomorea vietnamensis]|uniref:5-(carboxyamino)imidazole ribonucleotide synthase n=1 Tax=Rossellomorea vietnamensis TaxID=218284 RepID=UPI0016537EDD|nr:5-(carboxyamino)imidazole ribonucleotide synthase [Rossellomorea vietnamensis]
MSLNNKVIYPGQTIGIIGGGQLGRMMALAAKEAGFRIAVLDPGSNAPCAQVADEVIIADFEDREALEKLAGISDVITYEFENIDYEALKDLTEKAYVPQGAELIRITQNRIAEKEALVYGGVEVAPYEIITNEQEIGGNAEELGYPVVLKTARGGYDGKGQVVLYDEQDIEKAAVLLANGPCVLEKWMSFEKEVSVIVTRTPSGKLSVFPAVENIHRDNILHQTIAPARISRTDNEKAVSIAKKVAETLDMVGTLAVEMFLTESGGIYVNELAPRPHNSGHFSIEACETSQFAQHIRAICNWPLKRTDIIKPAVMVNVLGEHLGAVVESIPNQPDWSIHLYGKDEPKAKRKMGHVTILTSDIEAALKEVNETGIWDSKEMIGGKLS